jgi:hypothetical protein
MLLMGCDIITRLTCDLFKGFRLHKKVRRLIQLNYIVKKNQDKNLI